MSVSADHLATPKHLVLVTGAGRSGTSTIAGVFSRLNFHVPQPVLQTNESNPRGFYESTWSVRFHNALMKRGGISPTDGRPAASSLVGDAVRETDRDKLDQWLSEQFATHRLVMVKDPRAAWVPRLWVDTAEGLGVEIGFTTMLRHPTEVISSRRTHYSPNLSQDSSRTFAIRHLCGWINQTTTLERLNRGRRRTFVSYPELLADWRPVVAKVLDGLDLSVCEPTSDVAREIDAFIDPRLRRHYYDWRRFDLPKDLVDIADGTWSALDSLARSSDGRNVGAERALDEISQAYAELHAVARAMSLDEAEAMARSALREGRRKGRRQALEERAAATSPRGLVARTARSIRGLVRPRR